ncbi:hypothetical protein LJC56_01655 [Christensenellaceae bacterium OttesenSCG-928-K19]|nr:hypothetical protein [Christensenellaceae bacterium OttesenSCG-928-K19]
MTVNLVYIVFIGLIAVLAIVSIYFISDMVARRREGKKVDALTQELRSVFARFLPDEGEPHQDPEKAGWVIRYKEKHPHYTPERKQPGQVDAFFRKQHSGADYDDDIRQLKKQVMTKAGLQAFNTCYSEYVLAHGYTEKARDFAGMVIDYRVLQKNKVVRDKYRTSYILYLLAEYRIYTPEVEEFALRSLNDKSLYVRGNALRVIKNTGDIPLMAYAFETINKSEHYYNDKVLIDFLDSFAGDLDSLDDELIKLFDSMQEELRVLLITHFTNRRNNNPVILDKMLECMEDEDMEVVIAATKYFGWMYDKRAHDLILQNLGNEQWEIRAQSARVAQRGYGSPQMIDRLECLLGDGNWFVRMNSAYSFINMVEDEARINAVLEGGDRYAREITMYVMFDRGKMDYDRYTQMMEKEAERSLA